MAGELTIVNVACPFCGEVVRVLNLDSGGFVSGAAHGSCCDGWGFTCRYAQDKCVSEGTLRQSHMPVSVYTDGERVRTETDFRQCPEGDVCIRCGAVARTVKIVNTDYTQWELT